MRAIQYRYPQAGTSWSKVSQINPRHTLRICRLFFKKNIGSNFVTLSLTSAFTLQVVSVCVVLYLSLRVCVWFCFTLFDFHILFEILFIVVWWLFILIMIRFTFICWEALNQQKKTVSWFRPKIWFSKSKWGVLI